MRYNKVILEVFNSVSLFLEQIDKAIEDNSVELLDLSEKGYIILLDEEKVLEVYVNPVSGFNIKTFKDLNGTHYDICVERRYKRTGVTTKKVSTRISKNLKNKTEVLNILKNNICRIC